MNLRTLGQSDIEISSIGLGTNYVGGHNLYADVDEEAGVRLVQRAMDEGVTHLDTYLISTYLSYRQRQVLVRSMPYNRATTYYNVKRKLRFYPGVQKIA